MSVLFQLYDQNKWTVPDSAVCSLMLEYLHKKLLPFPQTVQLNKTHQLIIYAESMQTLCLNPSSSCENIIDIIADISTQIAFSEKHGHAFIGFDWNDIVKIRVDNLKTCYVILTNKYLVPIKNNIASVLFLSSAPQFCCSDLSNKLLLKQFPINLHFKSGYYAFGKYIEHILGHQSKYNQKITGFLNRCFDFNQDARRLLYL